MVATFDGLNRFETPMITLCRPSSKFVDGVATAQVGILTDVTDQEIIFNFNAPSELNFRVTQVIHDELPEEERLHILEMFRKIEARRLLYVQDIGYFMITSVQEDVTENVRYKDVTAETCEQEMANKGLPYIEDGTYQFRDLLETVIAVTPKWTIGDIDENIALRYRTFEDVSTEQNVLAFLMQDMQDAYECIFLFDIQNRIINVYDQANYVRLTDIHITHKDFMEHLDVTYNTDDLYTAITVFGDEDLNINAVNPLGTGTIYNFDHYIDWMSPELGEKVSAWQDLIESVTPDYYDLNMAYYGKLTDRSMAQHELDRLNIVLTMYQRARENTVAQASLDQIASYNAVIVENGGTPIPTYQEIVDTLAAIDDLIEDAKSDIADVEAEIASLDADIASILVSVNAIRNQVAISTYFTEAEYEELSDYIFEGEYTDEYVTVTESMDYAARFRQMKLLYDRAVVQLEKISVPTQEFSVDVENFIFHKDFQPWTNQLETGCLINVEVNEDDVAQLFLSTITVNYEDLSLSMKFGNRYNKFDPESLFKDALGNLRKTANSVNYLRDAIYPIKNGELDYMQQEIENSRTLTKNAVLAARNETVVIDDTGYTGRRIDPDTGEYDPKQIKITGRNIVFTDDAWDTAKTALGEIMLPGSQETTYGINAETVIGNLIVGQELRIINSSGEDAFVESDNAVSTVVVEYALSDSTTTAPSSGWSEVAPEWEDGKYMWQRTTTEYADGHQVISDPTCIAGAAGKDGQDGTPGQDGADGLNNAVVSLYKRSATAAVVDWTDTLTYSFRNAALIAVPTGWSETIPVGTDPVYMTAATASSSSLTDTIAYTEWSTPVIMAQNGEDGAPGAPGAPGTNGSNAATVFLYQRAESATGLVKPESTLTYTFATGTLTGTLGDWSQTIPENNGNPLYIIQATAVSTDTTDEILASEWSEIRELVQDGTDGAPGADGLGITSVEPEYYLSTSQSVPTGGEWLSTCPAWTDGAFIWTRSRITWEDGSQTTTEPVLDTAINDINAELVRQSSEIIANSDGIRENFEYYSELNGEVEDIRAYVQTGYLGQDSSGNQLYGVRIGKNDGTSDFSSMFTTDEVGFYDGDDKLAFLSNKKLNVSDGRFSSIEMTDDISNESKNKWRITCDSGYTIKYVG